MYATRKMPHRTSFPVSLPPPPKRGRRRGAKALLTYRISALSPSFFRSSRDVTYKNALVTACLEEDNEKRGELSCLSSSTASAFYEQKKAREKKRRKKKTQRDNTITPPHLQHLTIQPLSALVLGPLNHHLSLMLFFLCLFNSSYRSFSLCASPLQMFSFARSLLDLFVPWRERFTLFLFC